MKIEIAPSIFETMPNFKLGIIHYNKTTISDSPQMLKGRLQLFQEQLFFELEERPLQDIQGIAEWRAIWNAFGADSNRCLSSVEELYQNIRQQRFVHSHSTAIDLNTLFSLQYGIPSSMYDASKLVGDVQITIGQDADGYDGLNGRFNSLHHLMLLKDQYSSFGSPFVDSVRTAITEDTTEIIHVLFLKPSMNIEEAQRLTDGCGNMFIGISGGDAASYILDAKQSAIQIPVTSSQGILE